MDYDINVKLPRYTLAELLAGKFSTLFMRKITGIWDDLLCTSTGDLCRIEWSETASVSSRLRQ